MDTTAQQGRQPRGGRGARERILWAAATLFYENGITATGMEQLTATAHVSRRTFYQHFPSKSALVEEYLQGFENNSSTSGEGALNRRELPARERLLAVFDDPADTGPVRGCPFHNAAVEAAGAQPAVRQAVLRHKQDFTRQLAAAAHEAGAGDPDLLARQLAVLFEGSRALATSIDSLAPVADARTVATILITTAIPQPPSSH